jgi:rod shape-determining protein MreD
MNTRMKGGGWVIGISLLLAFMLTAMPLPDWVVNWRPAWVAMVLIYWCMALPERIGIAIGWSLGLLLDVQQGTVLGQNALGLSLLAWLTIKSYQRIRVFPLFQQGILICIYILFFQFIVLWIKGAMGLAPQSWTFWMPAITSGLLWPWIFIILRDIRRKYRIA